MQRAFERCLVGGRVAAAHVDEREQVLGLLVGAVEQRARDRDWAERRAARWRFEHAADHHVHGVPGRGDEGHRRADVQVVCLRVAVVREGAVLSEGGEHCLRALLPLHGQRGADRGVDSRELVLAAEDASLVAAHAARRGEARGAFEALPYAAEGVPVDDYVGVDEHQDFGGRPTGTGVASLGRSSLALSAAMFRRAALGDIRLRENGPIGFADFVMWFRLAEGA